MLETYIEQLEYKYGHPPGKIYDALIFERNKILRRDYTIRERYFNGQRLKIAQIVIEQAYNILDRYYAMKKVKV